MINQAHASNTAEYYNRERPSITSLIKPGPNVILDLGCGSGAVGRKLLQDGKASEIVGVELFASAALEARRHYSKVICGDVEELEFPWKNQFDYVICGDILEHLKYPYAVVDRIHGWLKDDGKFICSVPNVRFWRIIKDLVFRGAWEYRDAGIMDRTHLRFFTRKSCHQMLIDSGFRVERSRMLINKRRYLLANSLSLGLLDEFLAPQIVVCSVKDPASSTSRSQTAAESTLPAAELSLTTQ